MLCDTGATASLITSQSDMRRSLEPGVNGWPLIELGCKTVVLQLYNHCTAYMCECYSHFGLGELLDDGQLSVMSKAPLRAAAYCRDLAKASAIHSAVCVTVRASMCSLPLGHFLRVLPVKSIGDNCE